MNNIYVEETELTEEVLDLLIKMSEDWENEKSCHGYRKNESSDIEGNRIFLARKDDQVLGYLFGHEEEAKNSSSIMPDGTKCFEVDELYVKPEYRNLGIGSQLFRHAEEAVSDEVEFVMVSTATKNWRSILHFYLEELDMDFWSARLFKRTKADKE